MKTSKIALHGIAVIFVMAFCYSSAIAQNGNAPPSLLSGTVSPNVGGSGFPFNVTSSWEDPDADFIVDVTIRYRYEFSPAWNEVVLDFIPGSNPTPEFEKQFIIDGHEGIYEFQFRASDALTEDGPRIHTTDWIKGGTFSVVNHNSQRIGHEYEQHVFPDPYTPPTITVDPTSPVMENGYLHLVARVTTDIKGSPSLKWCTEKGYLEYLPEFPDYSKVRFIPPKLPGIDETVTISVSVGDGRGHVANESINVSVIELGDTSELDPSPSAHIRTPQSVKAGKAIGVPFDVSDLDENGLDSTESLISDLYVSIENQPFTPVVKGIQGNPGRISWTTPDDPLQSVSLKLITSDGNTFTTDQTQVFSTLPLYSITGTVTDQDGLSIVNAGISFTLNDPSNTATILSEEPMGSFSLSDINDGTYIVVASKFGTLFNPEIVTITLSPDNPHEDISFIGTQDKSGSAPVLIDINPGNSHNFINPLSKGKLKVAILSKKGFSPSGIVEPSTLTFGHSGDEPSLHIRGNGQPNCQIQDFNSDGIDDLVCHFYTAIAAFQEGDTEGVLKGSSIDGILFEGRDFITLPCYDIQAVYNAIMNWPNSSNMLDITAMTNCNN